MSDPISYPPRDTMRTLIGFMIGHDLKIDATGRLCIRFCVYSPDTVVVDDDALTELERRGWIEIHDDGGGITVTEPGCYWAKRWSKSHCNNVIISSNTYQ